MKNYLVRIVVIAIAGVLAACGVESSTAPTTPAKPVPTSMEGASCATISPDVEFGSWEHRSKTYDCFRKLAYNDWPKARTEAKHIATWGIANPNLEELVDTLTHYDSADAVGAAMKAYGLLNGNGEPGILEYYGEDWKPLTGSDWLLKAGVRYSFDTETGMHPNHHDSLLYELAELFGDALADATFAETAPHRDSDEPYQLHATLGDHEWNRQAENHGDWYDVAAVLNLINDMASDIGTPDRIMPLATYDQTATVIVGPGQSLIAAAADGLVLPAGAAAGMERGKAFEEEIRRRYRIVAE